MSNRSHRRRRAPRPATEQPAASGAALGVVLDDEQSQSEVAALIDDREPLFTTGGVTYTIPKVCPTSWSLTAYSIAKAEGDAAALDYATSQVLGPDAILALTTCPSLTKAKLQTVLQAVMDRVLPDGHPFPKA